MTRQTGASPERALYAPAQRHRRTAQQTKDDSTHDEAHLPDLPRGISRRQILKTTARHGRTVAAAKLNFPSGAFAQGAGPEVKGAKLGFIALTDAAPLFVAKEKGIFAKYGMPDVEVRSRPPGAPRATISCSARKATASTARIS